MSGLGTSSSSRANPRRHPRSAERSWAWRRWRPTNIIRPFLPPAAASARPGGIYRPEGLSKLAQADLLDQRRKMINCGDIESLAQVQREIKRRDELSVLGLGPPEWEDC